MVRTLDQCLNIEDVRAVAKRRAHKTVFEYIDGGADDEVTLRKNCQAFANYDLMYRVLEGVDQIDLSTTVLGQPIAVPFILSPSAGNRLFHTQGELAVARAAAALGTIHTLSTLSSVSIEEVAACADAPRWFQLYVWKDRALVKEMLQRAKDNNFSALVLTVDFPIAGNRERERRNGFTIPPKVTPRQVFEAMRAPAWTWDYLTSRPISYANLSKDTPATSLADFVAEQMHAGFNWKDAEWLLGEWGGPAVIKGVLRTDDIRSAIDLGFNAIQVSNHGGRQLDGAAAPLDVLAEAVQAAAGDAEVILDGGIRRGTDILKALALGAKAVSFARPYLFGLAAGGEKGVRCALGILYQELRRDMALLGITRIEDIDESFVRRSVTT